MSLERITGSMLRDNLARQGANLVIDTDLVFFDVANRRVGINNTVPEHSLDVNGTAVFQNDVTLLANLSITDNVLGGNATFSAIDNTPIGVTTPAVGYFTNIDSDAFITGNANIAGGMLSNVSIVDSVGIFDYIESTIFVSPNATVTGGNISGLEFLGAVEGDFETLYAVDIVSETFATNELTANVITGNSASIVDLVSDAANIEVLTSNVATIETLYANSGSVENLDTVSSNIGQFNDLSSESFTANASTISNLTVDTLTITGEVAGVVPLANVSYTVEIKQEIGSTPQFVTFANTMNGNTGIRTNSALTYIPNLGKLLAYTFEGSGNISTLTVNDTKAPVTSTVVRGASDNTLFATTTTGSYDTVIIGGDINADPTKVVPGSKLTVNSTDTMVIPVGDTGQRPSENGHVDVQGMLRFNTDLLEIEWYDGFRWRSPGEGGTTIAQIYLSSFIADGVEVNFEARYPTNEDRALVFVNGILQNAVDDYTIVDKDVTFMTPVLATSEIMVMDVPLVEYREKFIGDGVNKFFDTPNQYDTENILVFLNGILQYEGVAFDRTRDGIEFFNPVDVGYEVVLVGTSYLYNTVQFTGDGVTTTFDLETSTETMLVLASINGLVQHNGTAFNVVDREIIFSEPIPDGVTVEVVIISQSFRTGVIQSVNGQNKVVIDNKNISITTGGNLIKYINLDGSVVYTPKLSDALTVGVPNTIDLWNRGKYRSAKYIVQAESGVDCQLAEVLVIHSNGTVAVSVFGVTMTGGDLGIIDANIVSSNVAVTFTPTNPNTRVKILKEYIEL